MRSRVERKGLGQHVLVRSDPWSIFGDGGLFCLFRVGEQDKPAAVGGCASVRVRVCLCVCVRDDERRGQDARLRSAVDNTTEYYFVIVDGDVAGSRRPVVPARVPSICKSIKTVLPRCQVDTLH